MEKSLLILGRQPELSIAELKSLYSEELNWINDHVALLNKNPYDINFENLGGSLKLCNLISQQKIIINYQTILALLKKTVLSILDEPRTQKINFGISLYNIPINLKDIFKINLSLKKQLKLDGHNIRIIPNTDFALSSAQTYHNNLDKNPNIELILVHSDQELFIAKVLKVQNINSYTKRDRFRPKRDARVGMLPPKLAQIIINLATGNRSDQISTTVLDPFCGTGVILQEAMLMNYSVIGSDLSEKMVLFSEQNLDWLAKIHPETKLQKKTLIVGDATIIKWNSKTDSIASEVYLGYPFTSQPTTIELNETVNNCQLIIKKFLINLRKQIPAGTRICLAIPAWKINNNFTHLTIIDQLAKIGYNQIKFEPLNNLPLIYYRDGQFVARELLVLSSI